jgi:electron transfer flavoprotein beta subunit
MLVPAIIDPKPAHHAHAPSPADWRPFVKIVVTVKQVPDPNSAHVLDSDNTLARDKEVVLDPGDECGIEEGLQLKEAHGGEVILVSMGPERAKDAIRKGLSMGADRGILITDDKLAGADAFITAQALAAAIKPEQPDLVICGTESYDGSTGMVPPILAELLGVPQLTFAKKVEINGSALKVNRQTSDGYMVVEATTPALITVTAAIAEPRYASLKGIMAARSKEVKLVSLADLGIDRGESAETIEAIAEAETRKAGSIIEDDGTAVDQIVKVLADAKVI